jgi:Leucine rich repeat variant
VDGARVKQTSKRVAWDWALACGASGALLGAAATVRAILESLSSTAGIGFFFVPVIALIWAGPTALAGFCAGYVASEWRKGRRFRDARLALAGIVFLAVGTFLLAYLTTNLATVWKVGRVEAMDRNQLDKVLDSRLFGRNKFVLGAVARNPSASAETLHRIATIPNPELHERMGGLFPLTGQDRRGLAVMRHVALHPHVTTETLEVLAGSPDPFVLGEVARNPKLPEATLVRLAERGGQLIDWGVSWNPRAPPALLARLAQSPDQYSRSAVAQNPSTSPVDLSRLSRDAVDQVRLNVARNPRTPRETLEVLCEDIDERVRDASSRAVRPCPTSGVRR